MRVYIVKQYACLEEEGFETLLQGGLPNTGSAPPGCHPRHMINIVYEYHEKWAGIIGNVSKLYLLSGFDQKFPPSPEVAERHRMYTDFVRRNLCPIAW